MGKWKLVPCKQSTLVSLISSHSSPCNSLASTGDSLDSPLNKVDYGSDDEEPIHNKFMEFAHYLKVNALTSPSSF